MGITGKRLRTSAIAALAAASLAAGVLTGLRPITGDASSHREAPLIATDPQVDNTDVYAFVSPDDPSKVTLISTWIPFEEPAGGPNFYSFAEKVNYDIKIDNDGDAKPEVIYRWRFKDKVRNPNTFLATTGPVTSLTDPDLNFRQTYTLDQIRKGKKGPRTKRLISNGRVVPSHVGTAAMPNYEALRDEGIHTFMNGNGKTFSGQSDDPFFLDLRVFDLLYGADLSETGDDTLAGFNVNAIAIQVPKNKLAKGKNADANPIIGVWSTAGRPSTTVLKKDGSVREVGRRIQVSRLGMPLVNEVVIPVGLKDRFNASKPTNDGQFLPFVKKPELPMLLEAIYGIPAPATPRQDLISVFLTGVDGLNQPPGVTPSEQLRLNMSIAPSSAPERLGVLAGDTAGFPNGRRLADDVIDIALQVVAGELVGSPNDLGDAVDTNELSFGSTFPYLALPHAGSDPSPH